MLTLVKTVMVYQKTPLIKKHLSNSYDKKKKRNHKLYMINLQYNLKYNQKLPKFIKPC